ncbi:MAG TPA: ABC transporter ATP-binding protein [Burkholderiaceae bacterium]|nr:ABC transporter ATP-binding protein [Burkholderiaceae bacterium]
MRKVAVECRNVALSYGATAVLRDVDLRIEPGEFFALLGPSGSGKSTLLRLIAGFAQADRGEVRIDGSDVSAIPPHRRNVGMVFQNYALWPHLTVWDNVAFGLVERRLPKAQIRSRTQAALELVGLADLGQRRPSQLSGGQQQRIAVARTIVVEPQVLLLDEPLSNLDRQLRVQMRDELRSLQRKLGITTIFVTHDQEEAMTTADRMAVLDRGVVQQVGAPATLYDAPANRFVAAFVGTTNLLPAQIAGRDDAGVLLVRIDGLGPLRVAADRACATVGSRVHVALRPHALRLLAPGAPRAPQHDRDDGVLWFDSRVDSAEFAGEFTRYRLRSGAQTLIADQPHYLGTETFRIGAEVLAGIDPAQVRILGD